MYFHPSLPPLVRIKHPSEPRRWLIVMVVIGVWASSPGQVLAHAGHGDEFQSGSGASTAAKAIKVDVDTAKTLGLKVEAVKQQRLAVGIKATGQIEMSPTQQVEVTTPVRGTVTQLLVKPGDRVQGGQPVAVMTSPELAELRVNAQRNRAEAMANIQAAQANVDLARKNYQRQQKIARTEVIKAQTRLAVAQERFDRDQALAHSGALPRRQMLESQTQLAEAQAETTRAASRLEVEEADAQLHRADSDLSVAQSRLHLSARTYQTRLNQLGATPNPDGTITIKAPIAGIVADQITTLGESGEDAGKPILTLLNPSQVLVAANIYEAELSQIKMGQAVQVTAQGLPGQVFQGRVSFINPVVASETRVVPVKAELDNPDGVLKPGLFVNLDILTDRASTPVTVIPQSAVVETAQQTSLVFIQNGDSFQPVNVTLGETSGHWVEVKQGVLPGDRVVTQRAPQLYAQSLRSDPGAGQDHHHAADSPLPNSPVLPWWVLLVGGGVCVILPFWIGVFWAKRQGGQQVTLTAALHPDPSSSAEKPSTPGSNSQSSPEVPL